MTGNSLLVLLLALSWAPARAQDPSDADLARAMGAGDTSKGQSAPVNLNLNAALDESQGGAEARTVVIPTANGTLTVNFGKPQAAAAATSQSAPDRKPFFFLLGMAGAALIGGGLAMGRRKAQPEAAPPPAAAPSWQESNYPIVRSIGEGGMGVVYEAVDRVLDRKVAIKKLREGLRDSVESREQFLKEARTVAALHHPAIVDIHSVVEQAGEVYIVFEYVDGKTIQRLLEERKRFTLPETKYVLAPVCDALQFAHERGVIHRDLKPANVMINELGQVKVMDFGLARRGRERVLPQDLSGAAWGLTQSVMGTQLYMPPEAERGVLCPEGDVFSLAAMTYEMLSGEPPFPPPALASQKETRSYRRLAEALPALPAALSRLIDDALEPDPDKRLHSAREFWARLAPLS